MPNGNWTPPTAIRTCVDCGEQAIVKFPYKISERCRSCASNLNHERAGHKPPREYTCAVCQTVFVAAAFWGNKKRVCSTTCQAELYRRERTAENNPNFKHGRRSGGHIRGWNVKAKGETKCRNCGIWGETLHLHHIIPRGAWKAGRTDLRNGIPLCRYCHSGWHHRKVEIYRDVFTKEEWEFVSSADLYDRHTDVWLEHHYPERPAMGQLSLIGGSAA